MAQTLNVFLNHCMLLLASVFNVISMMLHDISALLLLLKQKCFTSRQTEVTNLLVTREHEVVCGLHVDFKFLYIRCAVSYGISKW